jgi:hypothetical protein
MALQTSIFWQTITVAIICCVQNVPGRNSAAASDRPGGQSLEMTFFFKEILFKYVTPSKNDRLNGQYDVRVFSQKKILSEKREEKLLGHDVFLGGNLKRAAWWVVLFICLCFYSSQSLAGLFFKQVQTVWLALCSVFWALYWISVESPPSSSIWTGFYFFFLWGHH